MEKITWKTLIQNLNILEMVSEGEEREINSSRMTRVGLELSGFFLRKQSSAAILLGKEEKLYLDQFSKEESDKKLEAILSMNPPVIILSRSFNESRILNLAKKYKTTLLRSNSSSSEINTLVNLNLLKLLSKTEMIHGNLIEVYGLGVLIIGDSGIGKSEITMELIKKGHLFIADDAVEHYRVFDKVFGKPSKFTKNLIEIRGIGIVDFSKFYGIQQIKNEAQIDVIIELNMLDGVTQFERLGRETSYKELSGIKIPYYKVPISPGRNASDIIEVIVNKQKLDVENKESKVNE